ncbi:hypothetical protein [Paenibacillus hexagrammi]|uniref:Uncharacterized protein n=1 Tax=Paenibacillus hexagrammi TaxID=2908839 RepID=A0ABY3SND7_9BACL|nr:hypothetical protein [Paenibacillus sp. YPD9-1]UJF35459.1 hypothetical protein L0M14_10350 [Paenibacillus sp. YPD9-1]
MIRKSRGIIAYLVLLGSLVGILPGQAAAEEKITYPMKRIDVQYAAEFTAYPLQGSDKSTVTTSVYDPAYSNGAKPIHVLYGIVKLTNELDNPMIEEFIRVTDGSQMTRGLSNSGGPIYDLSQQVRGESTEFVTGKKLEGNSVVKDYSEGWKTIRFVRNWDDNGNPTNFTIEFNWDGVGAEDPFFRKLTETSYQIDLSTINDNGGDQEVRR